MNNHIALPGDEYSLGNFIFDPTPEPELASDYWDKNANMDGMIAGLRRDINVAWNRIATLEARITALEGDGK